MLRTGILRLCVLAGSALTDKAGEEETRCSRKDHDAELTSLVKARPPRRCALQRGLESMEMGISGREKDVIVAPRSEESHPADTRRNVGATKSGPAPMEELPASGYA